MRKPPLKVARWKRAYGQWCILGWNLKVGEWVRVYTHKNHCWGMLKVVTILDKANTLASVGQN